MTPDVPPPIAPGRYRHFKGGEYEVFAVARHSETDEWLVVYRPVTGDGSWWVRPAGMFAETVKHDGRAVARFGRVEASPPEPASEADLE